MKREVIYQVRKDYANGGVSVVERTGYLYYIIRPSGSYGVGLVYERPYWTATHYNSGLSCTPNVEGTLHKRWISREELLKRCAEIPFESLVKSDYVSSCTDMVNEYKLKGGRANGS